MTNGFQHDGRADHDGDGGDDEDRDEGDEAAVAR